MDIVCVCGGWVVMESVRNFNLCESLLLVMCKPVWVAVGHSGGRPGNRMLEGGDELAVCFAIIMAEGRQSIPAVRPLSDVARAWTGVAGQVCASLVMINLCDDTCRKQKKSKGYNNAYCDRWILSRYHLPFSTKEHVFRVFSLLCCKRNRQEHLKKS